MGQRVSGSERPLACGIAGAGRSTGGSYSNLASLLQGFHVKGALEDSVASVGPRAEELTTVQILLSIVLAVVWHRWLFQNLDASFAVLATMYFVMVIGPLPGGPIRSARV
jgi:hypothetical protein